MKKKNVIDYRNKCLNKLKDIQEEIDELNKEQEEYATAFNGDCLKDLYIDERFYEGQVFACNYIMNNC